MTTSRLSAKIDASGVVLVDGSTIRFDEIAQRADAFTWKGGGSASVGLSASPAPPPPPPPPRPWRFGPTPTLPSAAASKNQLGLLLGLRRKVAACPEDIGHILGWALDIGTCAHAIGVPPGPIEPFYDAPPAPPRRLRWFAANDPRNLPSAYRRRAQALIQLLLLARGEEADREQREAFLRTDKDMVCQGCGLEYQQHPPDPFDRWLLVICNGLRVKL